jgi:hypothetical protein
MLWPNNWDRLLNRLEFHYVPKHASWLKMVEIEIGVRRTQWLDRRIDTKECLVSETRCVGAPAQYKMDVHNRESAHQNGTRLPETLGQRVNHCDEVLADHLYESELIRTAPYRPERSMCLIASMNRARP